MHFFTANKLPSDESSCSLHQGSMHRSVRGNDPHVICSNVRFHMFQRKKRHFRRFFDRLYDTLDMSVWIEKLTNRWPPIKNQPIKIQRIVWCRIIHRTIYILKMRHQNRDEFHQFQEYSSQIQNLVIVDHTADSGISLLRNTNYVNITSVCH